MDLDTQKKDTLFLMMPANAAPEGTAIYSGEILIDASPQFFDMLGYRPDELRGKNASSIIYSAKSHETIKDLLPQRRDSTCEATAIRKDGTRLPVKVCLRFSEIGDTAVHLEVLNIQRKEITLDEITARYAKMAAMAQIGHFIRDFRNNRGIWSIETYTIFGVSPDSFAPTWENFITIIHPDDRAMVKEQCAQALSRPTGTTVTFLYRIIRPDRSIRIISSISETEVDEHGEVSRMVGTVHDVTDQKTVERELQRSQQMFHLLTNAINDVFWISTRGVTEMIYISPAYEKVWGKTTASLIHSPKSFIDIIHPEDLFLVESVVEQYHGRGLPYECDYRIITERGERWIHERGYPVADPLEHRQLMAGICTDITERKKNEASLKSQKKTFETIFNSSPNILAIVNQQGCIEQINSKGIEFSGSDATDLSGQHFGNIFGCANSFNGLGCTQTAECLTCPVRSRISETFTTGKKFYEEEDQFTLYRDGEEKTLDLLISCAPVEIDGSTRALVSISDITQRKEIERHNMMLKSKLNQVQKLESIGTLAGGIAHDFNNILTAIIGFTDLALHSVEKNSTIEDDLMEVYAAGRRGKDLVRQILAFARQSDEKRQPLRIEPIIKEALKFLRSSIPTTVKISESLQSSALIIASPTQIHQVLMNLATNAAQAMEQNGGTLSIHMHDITIDEGDALQNIGLPSGDYVELQVKDTGKGISDEHINFIFEPYFTTKAEGEGTGLGLALVHGIVESYDGRIFVESEKGQGSTFTIYFPATRDTKHEQFFEFEEMPKGTEHILIVDDEVPVSKMISKMLESLGYKTTCRSSSIEALELFQVKTDDFDLVISDMTMPNMPGDILTAKILEIRPDTPVIICTGYSKRISRDSFTSMGARALLYKPILKADLAKTVRKVLDRQQGSLP